MECGPNSYCIDVEGSAYCSCVAGFVIKDGICVPEGKILFTFKLLVPFLNVSPLHVKSSDMCNKFPNAVLLCCQSYTYTVLSCYTYVYNSKVRC